MDASIKLMIDRIHEKHGVSIGEDDPVLIQATIQEKLLRDLKSSVEVIANNIMNEAKRNIKHSGELADKITNKALDSNKQALRDSMETNAKEVAKAVDEKLGKRVNEAKQVAIMNIVAACMVVLAAVLMLWASR